MWNNRSRVFIVIGFTLAVSLCLLTVCAVLEFGSLDSPKTTVFISPSSVVVRPNQIFVVNTSVSGVFDLYGWEFELGYDTTLLELVNVNEGSFLNNSRDTYFVPEVMSTDGYVLAGCTSLRNVTGVSGNGTLATAEFRAKKLGSCTLDLYDTKLVSSSKLLLSHDANGASVTVTIAGDVNGDFTVNILDAITLSNAFLATPASSNWNPNADINNDNVVNILDAIILSNHFLEHYP